MKCKYMQKRVNIWCGKKAWHEWPLSGGVISIVMCLWCAYTEHWTLNTEHSSLAHDGGRSVARGEKFSENQLSLELDRQQRPAQSGHWSPGLLHIIHVRHVLPSLDSYHPTWKEPVFSGSAFLYLDNRQFDVTCLCLMSQNPLSTLSHSSYICRSISKFYSHSAISA